MSHFRIISARCEDNISTTEPVTLAEAKNWLKVTFTDDDNVITDLIKVARRAIEEYCSISIVYKTVRVIVEIMPPNNRDTMEFELPYGPINIENYNEIQIERSNGDGTYSAMVKDQDYTIYANDEWLNGFIFARVVFNIPGVYRILFTAGYSDRPVELLNAMKTELAYQYENRGDENKEGISQMAKDKAKPYKRFIWL